MKGVKRQTLHRYTRLEHLLDLLRTGSLTLVSPQKWEDRNDIHYMEQYKRRNDLRCLLALCFAEAEERFHHWRVFTSGADGVRIHFDRRKLLASLKKQKGIKYRKVSYRKVTDFVGRRPALNDLPFLKRHPFKDEREFRILYASTQASEAALSIRKFSIDLTSITRITLSPWLEDSDAEAVKASIREAAGVPLRIYRSQLVQYQRWMALAEP